MNLKEEEKWISNFKAHPWKTIFMLLVLLLILIVYAYFTGFFGQKGKQHAISPNTNIDTTTAPKEVIAEKKTKTNSTIINQRTQGDQSPAVISGDNLTIEYDSHKEKNKKE
jgi:hypothetical protein